MPASWEQFPGCADVLSDIVKNSNKPKHTSIVSKEKSITLGGRSGSLFVKPSFPLPENRVRPAQASHQASTSEFADIESWSTVADRSKVMRKHQKTITCHWYGRTGWSG